MSRFYRITTDTDAVHWYAAETEKDAKEQHYDIHDPYSTDYDDARIDGIREGTREECVLECFDESHSLHAICWCEDELEEK